MRFPILALAMLTATLLGPAPAFAQRYLTEFVGTSRITASGAAVAIDSSLDFDTQSGRRLLGGFSYEQTAGSITDVELFSATATLAASGQCPALIENSTAKGHLHLVEHAFDSEVFALLGDLDLSSDGGDVRVTEGRLQGPAVFLRPPADPVPVALGSGVATLESTATGAVSVLSLSAERTGQGGIVHGFLSGDERTPEANLLLSAGREWLYFLAVGDDGHLLARGPVKLDAEGQASGTEGTYERVDASGKTVDGGVIRVDLGL